LIPQWRELTRPLRWWPAVSVGAVLVVIAPGRASAFHEPKLWILMASALGAGGLALVARRRPSAPGFAALGLAAAIGVSATLGETWAAPQTRLLLAAGLAMASWSALAIEHDVTARVIAGPLLVVAAIALLQGMGIDPLGLDATGRLAIAATLGNPDFVAGTLGAAAWLLVPLPRPIAIVAIAASVGALLLTRSLASALAFLASASFVVAHPTVRPPRWVKWALLLTGIARWGSAWARPWSTIARGRLYLSAVVLEGAALNAFGAGPGAVERDWPAWELGFWQRRCGADPSCVAAHPAARFTGLQDHVHDDWLEFVVELGVVGVTAWLVLAGLALRAAWRASTPFAGAVLVSLFTRALVDFPLHRPSELGLLALAVALVSRPNGDVRAAARAPPGPP
jgi:hypothetical protein